MSTLQTANIWFESTGNNRIQSSGSNGVTIFAGGSNVATVNTTAVTVSNTAYLMVGNSSVNTTVNATTVSVDLNSVTAATVPGIPEITSLTPKSYSIIVNWNPPVNDGSTETATMSNEEMLTVLMRMAKP